MKKTTLFSNRAKRHGMKQEVHYWEEIGNMGKGLDLLQWYYGKNTGYKRKASLLKKLEKKKTNFTFSTYGAISF